MGLRLSWSVSMAPETEAGGGRPGSSQPSPHAQQSLHVSAGPRWRASDLEREKLCFGLKTSGLQTLQSQRGPFQNCKEKAQAWTGLDSMGRSTVDEGPWEKEWTQWGGPGSLLIGAAFWSCANAASLGRAQTV
ncbi:hypothetical protein CapIbe_000799 [Capra ibex]